MWSRFPVLCVHLDFIVYLHYIFYFILFYCWWRRTTLRPLVRLFPAFIATNHFFFFFFVPFYALVFHTDPDILFSSPPLSLSTSLFRHDLLRRSTLRAFYRSFWQNHVELVFAPTTGPVVLFNVVVGQYKKKKWTSIQKVVESRKTYKPRFLFITIILSVESIVNKFNAGNSFYTSSVSPSSE